MDLNKLVEKKNYKKIIKILLNETDPVLKWNIFTIIQNKKDEIQINKILKSILSLRWESDAQKNDLIRLLSLFEKWGEIQKLGKRYSDFIEKNIENDENHPVIRRKLSNVLKEWKIEVDIDEIFQNELFNLFKNDLVQQNQIDKTHTGFVEKDGNITHLNLMGKEIQSFIERMDCLVHLEYLNLSGTKITKIPEGFNKLKRLKELNLSNNRFSEFPKVIFNLSDLKVLDLSRNFLTFLPDEIYSLEKMQRLYLNNNQLTEISENIGELRDLEYINLYFNKMKRLPESIFSLRKLNEMNLAFNKLDLLSDSVSNLKNLNKLDLSFNELRSLPESIGSLRKLEILNILSNQLPDLPDSIVKLKELKNLDISLNPLDRFADLENLGEIIDTLENNGCEVKTSLKRLEAQM